MQPKIKCLYDELKNPHDLLDHPKNSNTHPQEQLDLYAKIVSEAWRRPITVSKRSGFITVGHGGKYAAIQAGIELVPVVYQDYASESEELQHMEAENNLIRKSITNKKQQQSNILEMDEEDRFFTGLDEVEIGEITYIKDDYFFEDDEEAHDWDDSEHEKPEQIDKFPLSIVLNREQHDRFERFKEKHGIKTDTKGFDFLMDRYDG